jgi:hypothetical protein
MRRLLARKIHKDNYGLAFVPFAAQLDMCILGTASRLVQNLPGNPKHKFLGCEIAIETLQCAQTKQLADQKSRTVFAQMVHIFQ